MLAIGIDVGGTSIKGATIKSGGVILDRFSMPTDKNLEPEVIIGELCDTINKLLEEKHSSIIDENVDLQALFLANGEQLVRRLIPSQVTINRPNFGRICSFQFGGTLFQLLLLVAHHHNATTRSRQLPSILQPHPRTRPRDQRRTPRP